MKIQEALLIILFMVCGTSESFAPETTPFANPTPKLLAVKDEAWVRNVGWLPTYFPRQVGWDHFVSSRHTPPHTFLLSFVCFLRYGVGGIGVLRKVLSVFRSLYFQPRAT